MPHTMQPVMVASDNTVALEKPRFFIEPVALCDRWHPNDGITIVDTHFGDGTLFVETWHALQDRIGASATAQLHYIAVDRAPMTRAALLQHAAGNTSFSPLFDALHAVWPPATSGYHRLLLDGGRVVLTLIVGELAHALLTIAACADVFYVHAVSAQAVSAHDLKKLAHLAKQDARLWGVGQAKADTAQIARAGFVIEKCMTAKDGMLLCARFAPPWQKTSPFTLGNPSPAVTADRRAMVIGAGLAGAAMCERLTRSGWHVTLIEQHAAPAQEASGNLAGVYMPMVSQDDNPASRLIRSAYFFAQQIWAQVGGVGQAIVGEQCGVLQVARDHAQEAAFQKAAAVWQYPADFAAYMDAVTASDALGMPVRGGWFFPDAGWLRPSSVCAAMLAACQTHTGTLTSRFDTEVVSLVKEQQNWVAYARDGQVVASAPVVILANGMAATGFVQAASLPLTAIRGQVTHVPANQIPALPFVLCGEGYVTRAHAGVVNVGATYDTQLDMRLRPDSHQDNQQKLNGLLPTLNSREDWSDLPGRVGERCVTEDRLPLVGLLPDRAQAMRADHKLLDVPRHTGMYGLLGLGSRGLIWAPLAAEVLACQLNGVAAPVGRDLLDALDPARFALRHARRHTKVAPPSLCD